MEELKKKIKELEELTYRHELYIKSFEQKLSGLTSKGRSKEKEGKDETKSEIMKRAQQLRKEGLSMSEAIKKARSEIKSAPDESKKADTSNIYNEFKEEMRKRLRQRFYDAYAEEEDAIEKAAVQYDQFDYDRLQALIRAEDKILLCIFITGCPDCEYYTGILDEASISDTSIKFGSLTLDESEGAEQLAKKLDITTAPIIIAYKNGVEITRLMPKLKKEEDIQDILECWKSL